MKSIKNGQQSKVRLGAIGEKLVSVKLMELGFDVINANDAIKNCKKYDLVVVNPENQKTVFVQVKTREGTNFPIGCSIEHVMNDEFIHDLIGPWVFVYTYKENNDQKYEYYIVNKEQMAALAKKGHEWYYAWDRNGKQQPDRKSTAGIELAWLQAQREIPGSKVYPNKPIFENPLKESAENNWTVITDLLS